MTSEMPGRRLSQETISRLRKQRARKRIESKYPLFADVFYTEEIEQRTDYYDGGEYAPTLVAPESFDPAEHKHNPAETGHLYMSLVKDLVSPKLFHDLRMLQIEEFFGMGQWFWGEAFVLACNL